MNITIQNARPEDAFGNSEVIYQCWLDTYPDEESGISREDIEVYFEKRRNPEAIESRKRQIENISPNEKFLNAKDGKKIVGICRLYKHSDSGELKEMYVSAEYRNRGIGVRFWREALNFFDTNRDIACDVAIYNTRAVEFYKRLGFVDTGRRFTDKNYKMRSGVFIPWMEMRLVRSVN